IAVDDANMRRVDIFFADGETAGRLSPFGKKFLAAFSGAASAKWQVVPVAASADFQVFADSFRRSGSKEITNLMNALASEFYWAEGEYNLTVGFAVEGRHRPIRFKYGFKLAAED